MVEFNRDKIPLYKMIVHIAQIVLSVTIWCLEIVVFKGGDVNGQMGWTFGVCFLSVPAWIYLIMAPRYPRASNIAQPNALLTVDAIFIIIWLSAFATQAAYNTAGNCGTACGVSKAIVALGVFETLLWGLSTFISVATLQYYNVNGVLPGYDNIHNSHRSHTININDNDPDKAAFSTAGVDEEGAYAPLGGGLRHDHSDDEPEFNAGPYGGHSGGSSTPYGHGGGATIPNDPHDPDAFVHHHADGSGAFAADTSYGGAGAASMGAGVGAYGGHHVSSTSPAGTGMYSPPAVHDDDDYERPAQFPAGNYDNIGLRQV